jgi:ppGpp synthetase/RelA/SpoT-type nucleotidyltranferase
LGNKKALTLESFEEFRAHPWIQDLVPRYNKDAILGKQAVRRLMGDLHDLNNAYADKKDYIAITSIEGRVKTEASFFRKLYLRAQEVAVSQGLTQGSLQRIYRGIKDLCGVRFSCPYLDEVKITIERLARPGLAQLGYATSLKAASFRDQDYLDLGNEHGYRSYHFYVRVPTNVDIYRNSKLCLCEIQARSELQQVWALKSHDLLYKPGAGWQFADQHLQEDMRQVSNSLRAADQHLVSIRDRVRKLRNM